MGKRMGTKKEDGSIEMHLRFYPEKYEAHRIFVEQLRKYQETMGVGPSDALAAILYSKKENISEKKEHKHASQERSSGKTEKREAPDPGAGSASSSPDGYEESLLFGSASRDSDFFGGNL